MPSLVDTCHSKGVNVVQKSFWRLFYIKWCSLKGRIEVFHSPYERIIKTTINLYGECEGTGEEEGGEGQLE